MIYTLRTLGPLAQWLEQTTHNRLVPSSSLGGATNFILIYQTKKPLVRVAFLLASIPIGSKLSLTYTLGLESKRKIFLAVFLFSCLRC